MTSTFQLSTKPDRDRDEPAILVVKIEAPDNISVDVVYGRFVEMVAEAGLQAELDRFGQTNNAAPVYAPAAATDTLTQAEATVRNTFPNAQQVAPASPSVPAAAAPVCQHGTKTLVRGNSKKDGKPWQAWGCPSKQGDPTGCGLDFIRG